MLIPKKNRDAVYLNLFKEGVLVCRKDTNIMHHEVPNLHVMKLMLSMKSKGFVKETFSWQWYYYYLTNEGVTFLRDYLHLMEEVMPATLIKAAARPATATDARRERPQGDRGPRDGGDRRGGYRGGDDKKAAGGAPSNFKPGFGRGAGGASAAAGSAAAPVAK